MPVLNGFFAEVRIGLVARRHEKVALVGAVAEDGGTALADDDVMVDLEELLSIYPGFTLETASAELRKWNFPDEVTLRSWRGCERRAYSTNRESKTGAERTPRWAALGKGPE